MTATTDAPAAVSERIDGSVLRIAGVVVLGAIMSILDITVVNIAMPTFTKVFHTSVANVAWTTTGYTLALAAVIPVTGWAADRFGTKRLFMLAILLFAAGSALCASATSIGMLVTFRVLQGLGGGMLMPLGMTIMTHAAGPERVGKVMAILGVPMLLGPIGGPILGGWLIQSASWHWIFLINVPIGVATLLYAFLVLPNDDPTPSKKFDLLGMALLSPGLALTLFGVSSIPEKHTVAAARVLVPGILGLALVTAFVFHAWRKQHPLVDLHLLRNRNMSVAVITTSLFCIAFFGASILFSYYFIQVRGQGTLDTGLLLIPQGLGAMITMPIAGTLTDKIGPGKIVMTGLVLIVPGLVVYTQVSPTTPYWVLIGGLFIMGLGMGSTMMPVFTAALQTLTHDSVANGSTLMNILQQVSASIGTAVFSVVLTNLELGKEPLATSVKFFQAHPSVDPSDPSTLKHLSQADQSTLAAIGAHTKHATLQLADSLGSTFTVAVVLTALCLVPAFFLPRHKPTPQQAEVTAEAVLAH